MPAAEFTRRDVRIQAAARVGRDAPLCWCADIQKRLYLNTFCRHTGGEKDGVITDGSAGMTTLFFFVLKYIIKGNCVF